MFRFFLIFLGAIVAPTLFATELSLTDTRHCSGVNPTRPFMLMMHRDDDFFKSLIRCANDAKLNAAVVSGAVGALANPVVAYFNTSDHQYYPKQLKGNFELIGANGNIAWLKGKRFAHIHVALGGPNYRVVGGHLMSAKVAVVGELMITPMPTKAVRTYDENLHLMTISTSNDSHSEHSK